MRQYTTPDYTLTIAGIDLTQMDVYVTFTQGSQTLTIEDPAMTYTDETTTITVSLTQEQTAAFNLRNSVNVQVNWIDSNNKRNATNIKAVPVLPNLLNEVLEYGG